MKKYAPWVIVTILILTTIIGVKWVKDATNTKVVEGEENQIETVWVNDFDMEELKKHEVPILIDFTAEWCIPCRTFNPILEEVKEELGDQVIIKIIDADKSVHIASQYPLRVIPSQILLDSEGNPYSPNPEAVGTNKFVEYSLDSDTPTLTIHEGEMSKENLLNLLEDMVVSGDN